MRNIKDMPLKTRKRLQSLYELNYIDKETLKQLETAWKISINPTLIIYFSVMYIKLKNLNIPVADTLQMAIQHKKTVDLCWSSKRWQIEHEKLSRLATLKQLSEKNTIYNIKPFIKKMPKFKKGYLIKSSRRLGMEGLRQRHCLASYHQRLLSDHVAIAVVFYQKQRWTVELHLYPGVEQMNVVQIKSRYNKLPTDEEKNHIYNILGIKMNHPAIEVEKRSWKVELNKIIPILLQYEDLDRINIIFSGSGDSGMVDEIFFLNASGKNLGINPHVESIKIQRIYHNGIFSFKETEVGQSIKDVLSDIAYSWLEDTGVDWYNNDGGQGEITLWCKKRFVNGYVDYNFIASETAATLNIDFDKLDANSD